MAESRTKRAAVTATRAAVTATRAAVTATRAAVTATRAAIDEAAPWRRVPFEPSDATAIQALVRGDAPPHLQQRAINYIIYSLCGTYDFAYRPGGIEGDRDTHIALGKQLVGQQLVAMLKFKAKPGGEQP